MTDTTTQRGRVRCAVCGQHVRPGGYCVHCGTSLDETLDDPRSHFVAAPHEHRWTPRITSTLFARLPRRSLPAFQGALAAGLAIALACTLLGYFPLALVIAAVLVPVLLLLYLYDVDVYEDAPVSVVLLTLISGAAGGVATGLLAEAIAPSGAAFLVEQDGRSLLLRGVAIPIVSLAAMLAGPLVLLLLGRFPDALDGTTFGVASASAAVGAQVLTQSGSVLGGELRPAGLKSAWIPRIVELTVAAPVISAAVVGAVVGTFWLRHRTPRPGRRRAKALSRAVAVVAAALVLVSSALVLIELDGVPSLLALTVLALLALVWLRSVIQSGLLEEAADHTVGPEIRCANCGAQTPGGGFCQACGIALRALPKRRVDRPAGSVQVRLRTAVFAGLFAALLALTSVTGALAARTSGLLGEPICSVEVACAGPTAAPRQIRGVEWTSERLGVGFEFDDTVWDVAEEETERVRLRLGDEGWIEVSMRRSADAPALLGDVVEDMRDQIADLAPNRPHRQILGPNVGYARGLGAAFCGTVFNAQGSNRRVDVLVMAASRGGASVAVSVVSDDCEKWPIQSRTTLLAEADSIVNSVTWPDVP